MPVPPNPPNRCHPGHPAAFSGLPSPAELLDGLDYSGNLKRRAAGPSPLRLPLDRPAAPATLRALALLPCGGADWAGEAGESSEPDWPQLPDDWRRILRRALRQRVAEDRNLRFYLENCQRCGACADKCHLYLGTGDPWQTPVLRAELLRAVYRGEFSLAGRLLGRAAGAARPDRSMLEDWYHYFHQCSQCRRCALYCPLGIDTSEISALGRELLLELGLGREGVLEPLRRALRCGNHAGLPPDVLAAELADLRQRIEDLTGLQIAVPLNEKGREVLFVPAASDYLSPQGRRNLTGCLMLLHAAGLDYTISTYASGAENYGAFASADLRRVVGERIYAEAARLGCKWILIGDGGQAWRALQRQFDPAASANPPAGKSPAEVHGLETPRNPATGTLFRQAAASGALQLDEFAADLIAGRKIRLKPRRNRGFTVTFHDSCHAARSLGLLEEPRLVLAAACADFREMPAESIREHACCCGGGGGLSDDANLAGREREALRAVRLRGGLPRGLALRRAQQERGVNLLAASCSACRAALPELAAYWAPGVEVAGLYEILGNALVLRGEKQRRLSLRGDLLPGVPAAGGRVAERTKPAEPELAAASGEFRPGPAAAPGDSDKGAPGDTVEITGFLAPAELEELARLATLADDAPEAGQ